MRPYVSVATLAVAAFTISCAVPNATAQDAGAAPAAHRAAIAAAVAAPTRTPAAVARDAARHPVDTLSFFRIAPSDTVVELWPGAGWYTEILAPLASAGGGRLIVAGPFERGLNGVRRMQTANAAVYGNVGLAEFPRAAGSTNPGVPDGSVDVVLTFRNVHNWRFGGVDQTTNAFRQIYAMLRPGGRLGIVEHRLPEARDSALEESSGYMKRSSVVGFAEAAGFRLVGESEVNANPRDTADHPQGVWMLPPVLRGGDVDRARFVAIGESDRMTLLFVKPER